MNLSQIRWINEKLLRRNLLLMWEMAKSYNAKSAKICAKSAKKF
jgi:hypothetical protein